MSLDTRCSSRSPPRWILAPISGLLLIGCGVVSLVPVDGSRFAPASRRFSSQHTPYRSHEVVFSHATTEHAAEPCATCHFGTATAETTGIPRPLAAPSKVKTEVVLPSMSQCFKCHDGKSTSNDCITCHLTSRKDRKPEFHDAAFPQHHKDMAYAEEYKCVLCHIQGECRSCHSEMKPLSHTPRFNRSTHGRLATHDRRACATCHETGFCENCHSQPPPDHTTAFMTGGAHRQAALIRGRSCLVCHRFESACADCHRK